MEPVIANAPHAPTASTADPVIAFVGTIVPDEARFHGPAFNRAGQMFQEELLRGMASAGTIPDAFSPFRRWPRSLAAPACSVWDDVVRTASGLTIRLLPFVNVQPFKAVTAGLAAFAALAGWAWRHRGQTRVIHCINLTMPPGLFVLLAARLTRSVAVVSLLDVWKPGALVADTWFRRMDFWLHRRLIPHFDGLVVVSSAIAEDFAPGRLVCHIDGGIAPDRFAGAPAVRTATTNRRFRVVLSGTLEAYNGIELARHALAHLSGGVELIVAGSRHRWPTRFVSGPSAIPVCGISDFSRSRTCSISTGRQTCS